MTEPNIETIVFMHCVEEYIIDSIQFLIRHEGLKKEDLMDAIRNEIIFHTNDIYNSRKNNIDRTPGERFVSIIAEDAVDRIDDDYCAERIYSLVIDKYNSWNEEE